MDNVQKLVIIDYSTCSVDFHDVASDIEIDDDFVKKLGHRISDCYYMVGDDMEINKHTEIIKK